MSDLREYVVRSESGHGGWAIIVLSLKRCYFSTVSDFGNYAFCWGSGPGMEFRRQFRGFYKHIWPRFVALLRAELEAEAKEAAPC